MENLDFVALDLETATFDRSSICEIGIAIVRDSEIVETHSWLVRPRYNYFDEFNMTIHGITPEMTNKSPNFKEVWKEVVPFLDGQNVIAHNSAFDMYALRDALDNDKITYPTFSHYCSMRAARYTISSYSYSLDCLTNLLGINRNVSHRAEDDAKACAKVFIEAINRSGVANLEEFQEKFNFKCGFFESKENKFKPQLANKGKTKSWNVSEIVGDSEKADPANYIYGKSICLTGTMSFGERKSILKAVADLGGIPMDSVTKKTDILVVGQQDYRVVGETGMSNKQKKALDMRSKGSEIEILSEKEFLNLVQLPDLIERSQQELNRLLDLAKGRLAKTDDNSIEIVIDITELLN